MSIFIQYIPHWQKVNAEVITISCAANEWFDIWHHKCSVHKQGHLLISQVAHRATSWCIQTWNSDWNFVTIQYSNSYRAGAQQGRFLKTTHMQSMWRAQYALHKNLIAPLKFLSCLRLQQQLLNSSVCVCFFFFSTLDGKLYAENPCDQFFDNVIACAKIPPAVLCSLLIEAPVNQVQSMPGEIQAAKGSQLIQLNPFIKGILRAAILVLYTRCVL